MNSLKKTVQDIKNARYSAKSLVERHLDLIHHHNRSINAVTCVLENRAIQAAKHIDTLIAQGKDPGPLAGIPFGVKDLFDIAGHVTTAGSTILARNSPATQDAAVIARLCQAGAIPLATLNMDEFAYGFVTDNAHYGMTLNPHDPKRFAGGSSGGSAASVAAGILPFSMGSDTNGSIRVPASLCGVWGLRPTYGRLSLQGIFPFSHSLDTIGPFCQSIEDLQLVFQTITGDQQTFAFNPDTIRVAQLTGWFERDVDQDILDGISNILTLFKHNGKTELSEVATIRAASFVITASEGGTLHLPLLRKHANEYDPATKDRLIAGGLLPASTYLQAKKIQTWFQKEFDRYFEHHDLLIAPATGSVAPLISHPVVRMENREVSARVNLGLYTQPISLSGYPVLSLPLHRQDRLPAGLQLIARPNCGPLLFAVSRFLEQEGFAKASIQSRKPIKC